MNTLVHFRFFVVFVLHIVLVLCCVLIVCCGIVFALFCFVFCFVFVFFFFVSFFVCFVCLRLMFCVPNIANVCHCIVHSWLSLRFSLTFILYIYLFIIRDSKVVIVIIATFVQPDNRRRVWRNQSDNQWQRMKKPEYPERTTDHGQATAQLYHLRLRVECTLFCNLHSRREPTPYWW